MMNMKLFIHFLSTLIMVIGRHEKVSVRCPSAYGAKPISYVPSPPGERPRCAHNGNTYCEYPEHYPRNLVMYLLEKWKYDHRTLLQNETPHDYGTFYMHASDSYGPPANFINAQTYPVPSPVYGPPNSQFPYPPSRSPSSYTTTTLTRENLTYYQPQDSLGFAKAKFPYFQDQGQSLNLAAYYPGRGNPQAWAKWSERKFYARRKRSLAGQRNATHGHLLGASRPKRQDVGISRQTLCDASARYIMPRAAMNNRGDWMYVANVPELDGRYSQLVRTESCISQRCKSLCGLPDGYSSQCEQKYVQKRLIALEPGGGNLYTDVFWFPSCCLCTIAQN